ncbi:MAG: hypothetical protein FWC46_09700 [Actinomycetia bacterium]|nr:hypothetical protein [Actinomycetes bacterium]
MALALPDRHFGEWAPTTYADIAAAVTERRGAGRTLVLVDGSSGSGKTTFALTLADALPGAGVVHTDDIAWNLHPIDWTDELMSGVVRPWMDGVQVDYRPPGWITHGRPGSVTTTATDVLIIEGVGAGRHELVPWACLVVWVQTPHAIARERVLTRDIGIDGDTRDEVAAFFENWAAAEVPFYLAERPWDRADLVVDGSSDAPDGAIRVVWR